MKNESIVFTIDIKSYHVEDSINDDNNYNSKHKELHGSHNGRCWGMSIAHIVLFIGALDPPFLILELVQRLLYSSIVLECNATAAPTARVRRHVRSCRQTNHSGRIIIRYTLIELPIRYNVAQLLSSRKNILWKCYHKL